MLKKSYLYIVFLLLVGCGTVTNDSMNDEKMIEPEKINSGTPMKEHLTYYEEHVDARKLQKENLATNDFEDYTDPYTTEESQNITEELMKNKEIIVAEVRIFEDQVFVAVRLNKNIYARNHDMGVASEIEDEVREIIKDDQKQIIVYTDHAQWQRLKNHHAKPQNNSIFDKFFKSE